MHTVLFLTLAVALYVVCMFLQNIIEFVKYESSRKSSNVLTDNNNLPDQVFCMNWRLCDLDEHFNALRLFIFVLKSNALRSA